MDIYCDPENLRMYAQGNYLKARALNVWWMFCVEWKVDTFEKEEISMKLGQQGEVGKTKLGRKSGTGLTTLLKIVCFSLKTWVMEFWGRGEAVEIPDFISPSTPALLSAPEHGPSTLWAQPVYLCENWMVKTFTSGASWPQRWGSPVGQKKSMSWRGTV